MDGWENVWDWQGREGRCGAFQGWPGKSGTAAVWDMYKGTHTSRTADRQQVELTRFDNYIGLFSLF
jgi:hypothetical protein